MSSSTNHDACSVGLETSVTDWILDHPATAALFDELAIDANCPGKSLEYVCRQRGLDPHNVITRLHALILPRT